MVKGLIPVVKSWLYGESTPTGTQLYQNTQTTQTFWQLLSGSHSFNRKSLQYLVETGYSNNPVGFGIINKILLAQRNIIFTPYTKGKPLKSASLEFDVNFALQMLITTGTVFLYKKEIVGFSYSLEVWNTIKVSEYFIGHEFKYQYDLGQGQFIKASKEELIIINLKDISAISKTNFGISPLQAALMPIESLKEMYIADTATLKNKGVDAMITNDSDEPITTDETKTFDSLINERISGARRSGGVATSTAKLRILNLGRTTKELALWDGYKIKMRDLCNVLQIDSGQFNDPDNKKFANVIESNKALYTECVIPFTRIITENKELKAFLKFDIYLDVSQIDCLQTAQSLRFEKNNMITNAIINLNEKVKSGAITRDIAIALLVSNWDYDIEEASLLIQ